jgi:hypothetical protein
LVGSWRLTQNLADFNRPVRRWLRSVGAECRNLPRVVENGENMSQERFIVCRGRYRREIPCRQIHPSRPAACTGMSINTRRQGRSPLFRDSIPSDLGQRLSKSAESCRKRRKYVAGTAQASRLAQRRPYSGFARAGESGFRRCRRLCGPLSHAWSFFEPSPLMIDVAAGMRRFCTVASNGF